MIKWVLKNQMLILFVVVFLLGWGFGFMSGKKSVRCPDCPKCPKLVARSHVERDSIIMHDTVRVVKYAPSITVKTEPTIDTAQHDIVTYEIVDTMPDQAVIGFTIASRELPDWYLPDLKHAAWYLAKPDRIRIINDTFTVQLPCPQISGKRFGWTFGPYFGAGVDWRGKPVATAGLSLSWGIRLGKLTQRSD